VRLTRPARAGAHLREAPTGFIRKGWRPFVIGPDGAPDAKAWEICVLFELRGRQRAGDVWVAGSRRFRSFEETLIPRASFAALLRAEGPLPVGVPEDPRIWLDARRTGLAKAMTDVAAPPRRGRWKMSPSRTES